MSSRVDQDLSYPLMRNALASVFAVGVLGAAGGLFTGPSLMTFVYLLLPPLGAAGLWALQRGHRRTVAWPLMLSLALLLSVASPFLGGHASPAVFAWPVVILFAALVLGLVPALAMAGVGAASILGLVAAEANGWVAPPASVLDTVLVQLAILFATADMAGRTLQKLRGSLERSLAAESVSQKALDERNAELNLRRRVEQKLQDALRESKAASEAKSRFLANMSHELRTPLNAIIGYAEILVEESADEFAAQDAGRIRTSGKHLLSLINDVLDLSKIEAGGVTLVSVDVDLANVVEEVAATVQPRIDANESTLEVRLPPDLRTVQADPMRLRQVLLNLLSNAAKFTESGSVVLEIEQGEHGGQDVVFMHVHDSGIGISDAQMARLFRPFAQADDSTVRRFGGTGLGLVLSKRLAEMMEGEIQVHSELGVGSTFTFVLPVSTVAGRVAALAEARAKQAEEGDLPVVLCIDDEAHTLHLLDRMLTARGVAAVPCMRPKKALELARRLRPSAITLDLDMPGLDGWTVLEQLKADEALASTPVIIVSVDGDDGAPRTQGAHGWLQKPVDREQLLALIDGPCPEGNGPVLVVEDDDATREVVRRTLTRHGVPVVEARNGFEAMATLEETRPRLVLLDLMMPVMDGFAVVERLREARWADIPVVVLTAAELSASDRERLAPVQSILTKSDNVLRDLVEQVHLAAAS